MPATGADQLRVLAARCKAMGDRGLLNTTRAEIRAEARPLIDAMQESALRQLPKRGGLNEQVASQKWSISVLTGARTAGVRLRTTAPDTGMTDAGFVRHPTFGRRGQGQWRTQAIPRAKGWASDTANDRAPRVTARVGAALSRAVSKIAEF